jgi:hypothetical protein
VVCVLSEVFERGYIKPVNYDRDCTQNFCQEIDFEKGRSPGLFYDKRAHDVYILLETGKMDVRSVMTIS